MSASDLLILALACWRVAYFVSHESGPYALMQRIREHPRASKGLACVYCLSVWSAGLLIGLYFSPVFVVIVWILAISGAAMMLHRWVGWNYGDQPQSTP